jgi:hypothetical protein
MMHLRCVYALPDAPQCIFGSYVFSASEEVIVPPAKTGIEEDFLMRNWMIRGSLLTAMVLALTFSTAIPASLAAPKPQPATPAAAPEMHPEIRDALSALERAKTHLHDAKHDFGGHRVDAIAAINAAERQLNICMKYDN